MTPFESDISRVPSFTVKCELAPRRVMVWSLNSISVRESIPVRTDFPGSIGSFTEARTGAFPGATVFTSLTMWVILAPVSGAAVAGSAAKNRADRMEDRVRIFIGKETGMKTSV